MGQQPQESPRRSSDKVLWSQIYKTLKEMLKSQQSQIETLINDRELLEDYVHFQHEQWCRRSRFLESHIAQMKEEHAKTRLVEDARMGVFVGFKESEALCCKMQLDLAENDLDDFRSCMEAVTIELGELKEKLKSFEATENVDYSNDVSGPLENLKGRDQSVVPLKKEIKKLKHACRELSSRKDAEVSALLAEKDFVWNQFKKMENDYIALLKSKRAEANLEKKFTENLQNSVEKLMLSINEKDEIIAKLEAERGILVQDVRKHAEEVQLAERKLEKINIDMDELRSSAMAKENIIGNLREEVSKLMGDSKKNIQENSRGKSKYGGKSQNGPSKVMETQSSSRKRYLNSCDDSTVRETRSGSRKRYLDSCDTGMSHTRRSSLKVTFEKPAPDVPMLHQGLRGRTPSPAALQSSLFHSDFKVPKLKRAAPLKQ